MGSKEIDLVEIIKETDLRDIIVQCLLVIIGIEEITGHLINEGNEIFKISQFSTELDLFQIQGVYNFNGYLIILL